MKAVERRGDARNIVHHLHTALIPAVPIGFRTSLHAPLGQHSNPFPLQIPLKSVVLVIHRLPRVIADFTAEPVGPGTRSFSRLRKQFGTRKNRIALRGLHPFEPQPPLIQPPDTDIGTPAGRTPRRVDLLQPFFEPDEHGGIRLHQRQGEQRHRIAPDDQPLGSLPCRRRAKRLQKHATVDSRRVTRIISEGIFQKEPQKTKIA